MLISRYLHTNKLMMCMHLTLNSAVHIFYLVTCKWSICEMFCSWRSLLEVGCNCFEGVFLISVVFPKTLFSLGLCSLLLGIHAFPFIRHIHLFPLTRTVGRLFPETMPWLPHDPQTDPFCIAVQKEAAVWWRTRGELTPCLGHWFCRIPPYRERERTCFRLCSDAV